MMVHVGRNKRDGSMDICGAGRWLYMGADVGCRYTARPVASS